MATEAEVFESWKNKILSSPEFNKRFDDLTVFILENFKSKIDAQNKKLKELEENINSSSDNVNQVSTENARLSKANRDLSSENTKLSNENVKLGLEKQSLTNNLTSLEDEMKSEKKKIKELKERNEELEKKVTKSDSIIENLQSEQKRTNESLTDVTNKLSEYKQKYDIFVNAESLFSDYQSMSDDTKKRLESVFEAETYTGFISNGLQWENISILWNFMKKKIIESDMVDIQTLIPIFKFFFDFYNSGLKESRYALLEPKVGTSFDKNTCAVVGSGMDGKITEVFLPGYKDLKTDEVFKALVSVK